MEICQLIVARAREPGRGREANTPEQIPPRGWGDILWRVLWSISANRILSTAGRRRVLCASRGIPSNRRYRVAVWALCQLEHDRQTSIPCYLASCPVGFCSSLVIKSRSSPARRTKRSAWPSSSGLLIALGSANSGMAALFDALNVVYNEREKRSLVRFYTTTLLFTFAAIAFIIVAITGVVVVPLILKFVGLASTTEQLLAILRWPILLTIIMVSLAFIYRFGPSRRDARWRWVTWGSILGALLWVAASMLFSWYVTTFDSYNRIYGSLGAGVGFMVWLWISAVIVLLGGQFNAEMEHQTARDTTEGVTKPLGSRGAMMADHVGEAQA